MSLPFHESLRRLLRLRQSLERQEEMKLSLAAARLHAARAGLEQARAAGQQQQQAMRIALTDQLSGAELQVAVLQRQADAEREQRLQAHMAAMQSAHADQTDVLLGRTRDRKILDLLQAHCQKIERRNQLRREQAALDEAFLLGKQK
ncbi:MAG TPA: hypothetical protein VMV31_00515 [Terriglobales bacterium]|nr:hypothetical protein [Terriglobales bacterium]